MRIPPKPLDKFGPSAMVYARWQLAAGIESDNHNTTILLCCVIVKVGFLDTHHPQTG
jgi:hypothetical protein